MQIFTKVLKNEIFRVKMYLFITDFKKFGRERLFTDMTDMN